MCEDNYNSQGRDARYGFNQASKGPALTAFHCRVIALQEFPVNELMSQGSFTWREEI